MDEQRFDAYVRAWTERAAQDLDAARRAALRWSTLALVLLPTCLLLCAGVAVAGVAAGMAFAAAGAIVPALLVAVCIGGGGGIATYEIARSLGFRFPAPDGLRVERDELRALWARVDRVAAAVGAEPPGAIFLERGFAAYAGTHASGPLTRSTSLLGLGLTTFAIFDEDELDAIIAHELAHLLHSDATALRRTRRAIATWSQLDDRVHYRCMLAAQPGAGWMRRWTAQLLRWTLAPVGGFVGPRLVAIERAVAREHELAADVISARAVSPVAAARALVRAAGRMEWWNTESSLRYTAAVHAHPEPPLTLPAQAALVAAGPIDPWVARIFLARELVTPDDWRDEHPPLGRRLAMLGVGVDRPNQHVVTFDEAAAWAVQPASGALWNGTFGDAAGQRVVERVCRAWTTEQAPLWAEAHADTARYDEEKAQLAARATTEQLTAAEYLELAWWSRLHHGRDASRSWLVWATHVDPAHAPAALMLGRSLLATGDEVGVGWLQHACAIGPELTSECLHAIAAWQRSRGEVDAAASTMALCQARRKEHDAMRSTSAEATNAAPILDTPPSARDVAIIRHAARDIPELVGVWVGRLQVPDAPLGRPPVALTVQLRPGIAAARYDEIRAAFDGALHAAYFASAFDQWFTMYNDGPCPATTLGGRIEASPHCRVPGVGLDPGVAADIRRAA